VWRQLLDCDIGVLPSAATDWYQAKANTRMTMFKDLGIPVVASPIQSYVDTLTHGRSCYFARTVTDWAECLLALADPEQRRAMGFADRVRILAAYGFDTIGERWLALFEDLCGQGDSWERSDGSVRDH
jgi:glycosyltransferase involved in cell wall biosynthesis